MLRLPQSRPPQHWGWATHVRGVQGISSEDVQAEALAFWQTALARENEAVNTGMKAVQENASRPITAPTSAQLISIKVCGDLHSTHAWLHACISLVHGRSCSRAMLWLTPSCASSPAPVLH